MSPPRAMLRLDEKVAAETRRLAALGDRTPRLAIVAAIAGAALLHATLLALPLPSRFSPVPATTPRPELPFVWRWGPPAPAPERPPVARTARAPRPAKPPAPEATQAEFYEPVDEPGPNVPATLIPAEMENLIPSPELSAPAGEDDAAPPAGEPATVPADIAPLQRVAPAYPAAARSMRASGSVELTVLVGEDGSVAEARVLRCTRTGVGFEDSALAAVRRFRYASAPPGTGTRSARVLVAFQAPEAAR